MNRRRPRQLALALVLGAIVTGCGKKGPPLAPLVIVPARVGDLTVRRIAAEVYLEFNLPAQNTNGTRPADIARVEVYAMTIAPTSRAAPLPELRDFLRDGELVARLDVAPPVESADAEAGAGPAAAAGTRPGAAPLTVVDPLTPEKYFPVDFERIASRRPSRPPAPGFVPSVPIDVPPPLQRTYLVVGVSKGRRRGTPSAIIAVRLGEPPRPPAAPTVRYTEKTVTIEWQPPPGARRSIQPTPLPTDKTLQSRPIVEWPPGWTYEVYETAPVAKVGGAVPDRAPFMPKPVNATAQETTRYEDSRVVLGTERCYVVRTVDATARLAIRSAPSPPTCLTLRDTFPPAVPRGLTAVASEGVINLIWEPNVEADVAGYLILRGRTGDAKLQPLMDAPVAETSYRDTSVEPGVRYVYTVQAVDKATPPNASPPSDRVEELAR